MPANTGTLLPVSVSVFGVPNTGIPVSVYTGLETLMPVNNIYNLSFFLQSSGLGYNHVNVCAVSKLVTTT
jgi:hypothetical protein